MSRIDIHPPPIMRAQHVNQPDWLIASNIRPLTTNQFLEPPAHQIVFPDLEQFARVRRYVGRRRPGLPPNCLRPRPIPVPGWHTQRPTDLPGADVTGDACRE